MPVAGASRKMNKKKAQEGSNRNCLAQFYLLSEVLKINTLRNHFSVFDTHVIVSLKTENKRGKETNS